MIRLLLGGTALTAVLITGALAAPQKEGHSIRMRGKSLAAFGRHGILRQTDEPAVAQPYGSSSRQFRQHLVGCSAVIGLRHDAEQSAIHCPDGPVALAGISE